MRTMHDRMHQEQAEDKEAPACNKQGFIQQVTQKTKGETKRMVTQTDLVKEISEATGITQKDTKAVIDAFWEKITEHVKAGSEVQFIGKGKFCKSHREARKGRNPQTGAEITIAASDKVAFKSKINL